VRLFTPVDHYAIYNLESDTVLPAVINFLRREIFSGLAIGWVILGVWILGTLIYAVRIAISLRRDALSRAGIENEDNEGVEGAARAMGIEYSVVVSRQISVPHVAGALRPTIYLPQMELDVQQWRYVLAHEMQHIRSKDLLLKLIYLAVSAIFWWNPITHIFTRELDAMLELRCDSKVTAAMNEDEKTDYLETMLRIARQVKRPAPEKRELRAGFLAPVSNAKQRFENVLEFDAAKYRAARSIISFAILLVFALSYFVVIQPSFDPPPEDLEGTWDVNPDTSFILHVDGEYKLYIEGQYYDTFTVEDLDQDPFCDLPIYEGS